MTPTAAVDLDELLATAHVVAIPLRSRFRGIDVREAMLFRGPAGWAEWSPFVEYDDVEAAAWLAAALEFATAPFEAVGPIRVNATVPAVSPDDAVRILDRFPGCRTAKIKVADPRQRLADDVARVAAVRAALGPEGRIRVDANGGWSMDAAERAMHALERFDLEYVEQPCSTLEELAELRERIAMLDVPIAADESVRKQSDPLAVARAGAADILVVKAQPLGGIGRAVDIVRAAGLPAVVSSALETSVGIAMGAQLAAALPDSGFDHGLGTVALLDGDVCADSSEPVDGRIDARRREPHADLLDRFAAAPDRRERWLDRARRCAAVLSA